MEPFLGEIRAFSFPFAPKGWALCNGQMMPINQNQALYSLLGTYYGGDGQTKFALPDLRGRVPMHIGASEDTEEVIHLGEYGGEELNNLSVSHLPAHNHTIRASTSLANQKVAKNNFWAVNDNQKPFATTKNSAMSNGAISVTGGGEGHHNMQPYSVINYCIAITGLYPSRN